MKGISFLIHFWICIFALDARAQWDNTPERYKDVVFRDVRQMEKDAVYGSGKEEFFGISGLLPRWMLSKTEDLKIDIWEPAGDSLPLRPFILFIHGGAFIEGISVKEARAIKNLCTDFARRGYVTSSISYREYTINGTYIEKPNPVLRMYKAAQDAYAAMKYISYHQRRLGVDTSWFFIGGISAGAITAVNAAYLDKEGSSLLGQDFHEYGTLSGNAVNTFPPGIRIRGIISIAGAVPDTAMLNYKNIPVISFHGSEDDTIKLYQGLPIVLKILDRHTVTDYFNAFVGFIKKDYKIPVLYGPGYFHPLLEKRSIQNQLIIFQGLGHALCMGHYGELPSFMEIKSKSAAFLFGLLKDELRFNITGDTCPYAGDRITYSCSLEFSTYLWKLENGEIIQDKGRQIVIQWPKATIGRITLKVRNGIGVISDEIIIRVNVKEKPAYHDVRFYTRGNRKFVSLTVLILLIGLVGVFIFIWNKRNKMTKSK